MLHPRERDRDRTLTLLIYGLILSTVDTTAAHTAAEKITSLKDQGKSQIGTASGSNLKFHFKLSPNFMLVNYME